MKRILCFGSRTFDDREAVKVAICAVFGALVGREYAGFGDVVVVHGGCRGADEQAGEIALALGLREEVHYAECERYGNQQMLDLGVDIAIGFFDGATPGSMDMLRRLIDAGVPVRCVPQLKQTRQRDAFPYREPDDT